MTTLPWPILRAYASRWLKHGEGPYESASEGFEYPPLDPVVRGDAHRQVEQDIVKKGLWSTWWALTEATITIENGRPVAKNDDFTHNLLRLLDSDALVAASLAISPFQPEPSSATFDWSPLLAGQRVEVGTLFHKPLADLHVHMAGAIPSSLAWILVLTDLANPVGVFRDEVWAQRWHDARNFFDQLLQKYHQANGYSHSSICQSLAKLGGSEDPDWPLHVEGPSHLFPRLVGERRVLFWAFRQIWLNQDPEMDNLLRPYLCHKNAFHREATFAFGPRGLNRFRKVAAGHRIAKDAHLVRSEQRRIGMALEAFVRGVAPELDQQKLRMPLSVELRITLHNELGAQIRGWLLGIRDVLKLWPELPLSVGFIAHMKRDTDDPELAGLMARALVDQLCERPQLRTFLVGLDAAGNEIAVPPRTFITAYGDVRRTLDKAYPTNGTAPLSLGFTIHAGEDFRDLLTGIRHVDEAAHLLAFRPRDRIGHGTAVFWDVNLFYARRPTTYPRAADLLLDAVWGWRLFADRPDFAEKLRRTLTDRLGLMLSNAQMDTMSAEMNIDGAHGSAPPKTETQLVAAHLSEQEANVMVAVPSSPGWLELVAELQRRALTRLEIKGLAVEINPTSNLTVGGFARYTELPYLQGTPGVLPKIPLVVGSDNPGAMQTTIRREYEHLARALRSLGWTLTQVRTWLEHLRQTSEEHCFIPPWAPRGKELLEKVEELLG